MQYINENREIVDRRISKDEIVKTLAHIKRAYLPDWNYTRKDDISIPDKNYPLHIAMQAASKAIQAMDDNFFENLNSQNERKV